MQNLCELIAEFELMKNETNGRPRGNYVRTILSAVWPESKNNKISDSCLPLRPPKACSRPWTSLVPLGEVETTILGVSEVPGFVVASGSRGE